MFQDIVSVEMVTKETSVSNGWFAELQTLGKDPWIDISRAGPHEKIP